MQQWKNVRIIQKEHAGDIVSVDKRSVDISSYLYHKLASDSAGFNKIIVPKKLYDKDNNKSIY